MKQEPCPPDQHQWVLWKMFTGRYETWHQDVCKRCGEAGPKIYGKRPVAA